MWWWLLIACSRSHDYVKRTSSRFSLCGAAPRDSFRLWCGQLDYQAVHVPDIPRQNLKSPQDVALQSEIRLLVRSTQTRPWLYIPECSFLFIRSIKERFALTDALLLLKLHSMIAVYNSNCSIKDVASEACWFLILLRETSVCKVPLPPPYYDWHLCFTLLLAWFVKTKNVAFTCCFHRNWCSNTTAVTIPCSLHSVHCGEAYSTCGCQKHVNFQLEKLDKCWSQVW